MEKITDTFRVSTPIDTTWKVLLDVERIAPCMPGAQLQEVDGNEYRGIVKVKVGPITAQYKGSAHITEAEEAARRVVIDASGRDTRGQGNAKASVVLTMAEDGDGTKVDIETEVHITGKVAQFGRGVLDEVAGKLLHQFVDNLERDVLAHAGDAAEVTAGSEASEAGVASTTTAPAEGPRRIESAEVAPVDLFEVAGASVAKRVVPVVVAVLVGFVVWRLLRRGRR